MLRDDKEKILTMTCGLRFYTNNADYTLTNV